MGKNKLRKFSEMEQLPFVFQYPFARLKAEGGFPLRGRWHSDFFHNDNPIVLELGCGKGEYTVGLAQAHPERNYIGIDIKGARMWTGATRARDLGLTNVAFLRTDIELLPEFFAEGEVAEIWITFPDPQMKKTRKRLTSVRFMELYRRVLEPGGIINLKTDSPFLYTYTSIMADHNSLPVEVRTDDLLHTSREVEDASFLRLKNIQLGYTLPAKWLRGSRLASVRLYFGAQNVATITGYTGYDQIGRASCRERVF